MEEDEITAAVIKLDRRYLLKAAYAPSNDGSSYEDSESAVKR